MRFSISILALLLAAACAKASSQIQFDKDERRRDGAPLLYAEQIDENGWLQNKYVLPPCK